MPKADGATPWQFLRDRHRRVCAFCALRLGGRAREVLAAHPRRDRAPSFTGTEAEWPRMIEAPARFRQIAMEGKSLV
ncbi:hypothetical protein [Bradyrhizobium sp. CB1015]|uniref:hypothetical protein n=1 Tax=Bradyrhizobium sp. CB1015 TaxID=2976822 RepID=UPI0021AA9854|nr:hypothetical protein [Bradyrhizobium sp. CB1015]UWU91376.1 hypothetical protein N2604_33850 [Bradyrhizobium sp. CB1015]